MTDTLVSDILRKALTNASSRAQLEHVVVSSSEERAENPTFITVDGRRYRIVVGRETTVKK